MVSGLQLCARTFNLYFFINSKNTGAQIIFGLFGSQIAIYYKELEGDCLENYRKGSCPFMCNQQNTVETGFLGQLQDV